MEKEYVDTEILEDALTTKKEREEELLSIVKSDLSAQEIKERLEDFHANDIASVFGELDPTDRKKLYHLFSDDDISDIFSYLDNVEEYIAELDAEKAAEIIENMDAGDAVDVLEELEDDTRREIIDLMDEGAALDIEMISSFDEEQIGSRMTTNFIFIPDSYTVKQAMKSVMKVLKRLLKCCQLWILWISAPFVLTGWHISVGTVQIRILSPAAAQK